MRANRLSFFPHSLAIIIAIQCTFLHLDTIYSYCCYLHNYILCVCVRTGTSDHRNWTNEAKKGRKKSKWTKSIYVVDVDKLRQFFEQKIHQQQQQEHQNKDKFQSQLCARIWNYDGITWKMIMYILVVKIYVKYERKRTVVFHKNHCMVWPGT